MTILPKKKATQAKNEGETQESVQHHGGSHLQNISSQDSLNREIIYPNRTSPSRWHSGSSREGSSNEFDDYFEGLESSGGPCHSSSKRLRHRASPHRNVARKGHHHHRNVSSPQAATVAIAEHPADRDSASTSQQGQAAASVSGPGEAIEDFSGYNSGDEYGAQSAICSWTPEQWEELERRFEKKLRKKSYIIKKMSEDGACLFRAVADQVYGDQDMHAAVRNHCMDYMLKNSDYYSQYVTEDFNEYVKRKRKANIHGNHIEIQALSELYNRPIEIYHYSADPINTFHGIASPDNEPIRLSYHKSMHYNSIVNPYKATIGVGLGLPSFKPGHAEKKLMCDAMKISEEFQLEQAMLEDKLKATDWEATNEAIEEQVARESYLQWLKDNDKQHSKGRSSAASASSASSSGMACTGSASTPRSRTSPKAECSQQSQQSEGGANSSPVASVSGYVAHSAAAAASQHDFPILETASFIDQHPPQMFGLSEWEDADILAQVLAVSQQEYLDRLKHESTANNASSS